MTIIGAQQLAARLLDPQLALIDCRFDLARPAWGEAAWAEGHIPGALYAHLDRDLSSAVGPGTGRHPLPEPESFAARAGAWGIEQGVDVVAYDQGNGMFAARLWWLFAWLGHQRVAVLDGGIAAWRAAGLPVTAEPSQRAPRAFTGRADRSRWLAASEVERGLAEHTLTLVDARAADRFAGENETIDPVAGHVPGALNHPFARNLGADGRFLPAAELRERWQATLAGRSPGALALMCGSGVTACHDLLALELAGITDARLYPGSWSEWIRDPERAAARGPA